MWKYRCKTQLITLALAFVCGALMVGIVLYADPTYATLEFLPPEVAAYAQGNKIAMCASGGLVVAGIANIILIGQLLMTQFQISPLFIYLFLFLMPSYLVLIGSALVIPMAVLSIVGIVQLKTGRDAAFRKARITGDAELVRIYELHHKLDPQYRPMAEECRHNASRAAWIYALGIVAVMCVLFFVNNILLMMLAIMAYMLIFNYIARYRASCMIPITKLLYEQCDPEACISAIVYYSTRNGKIRLTNQALMAQCLIYLNDPQLAQDVLITYPRKDAASVLTYWFLMSYVYYLLKDESGLERSYEEAQKVRLNFGHTGVMIRSEELNSIKNRLDLMNGDFSECKRYFLQSLKTAVFPFQKADADYYIGLISFVQQDYSLAAMYFNQVVQTGGKLYFVQNARDYLEKIEQLNVVQEQEELQASLPCPADDNAQVQ
ncbi:hypothetical protein [uncultured Faecalibaculum sp.]|uniref:hypothetical protein n=2 Tax=uncultured Faecalibaculum sp. TaxID=1729681 RepID=UPI002676C750|nr:hypothetical protein [uncultured Faecalibaculum sp.]